MVVPSKFRERVMSVGHEALMSGHLGKGKTADRIMSSFYWPGAMADIKRLCASWDSCQRASPRGSKRNVPLVRSRSCPLIHWLVRGRSCPLIHWLVRGRSCPLIHRLVRGRKGAIHSEVKTSVTANPETAGYIQDIHSSNGMPTESSPSVNKGTPLSRRNAWR